MYSKQKIGSSLASIIAAVVLTAGCGDGNEPTLHPTTAGASGPMAEPEISEADLDLTGCTPKLNDISPRPVYWEAKSNTSTLAFELALDQSCPLPITVLSITTSTMPLLTADLVLPMYWQWMSSSALNASGLTANGMQKTLSLEAKLLSFNQLRPNSIATFTFEQNLTPFAGKKLGVQLNRITYRIGKTGAVQALGSLAPDRPLIYGVERTIGTN